MIEVVSLEYPSSALVMEATRLMFDRESVEAVCPPESAERGKSFLSLDDFGSYVVVCILLFLGATQEWLLVFPGA
jgi:hypothetical protein